MELSGAEFLGEQHSQTPFLKLTAPNLSLHSLNDFIQDGGKWGDPSPSSRHLCFLPAAQKTPDGAS